jgi:hypothetical protein
LSSSIADPVVSGVTPRSPFAFGVAVSWFGSLNGLPDPHSRCSEPISGSALFLERIDHDFARARVPRDQGSLTVSPPASLTRIAQRTTKHPLSILAGETEAGVVQVLVEAPKA